MIKYPKWIDNRDRFTLREVAPNIYVGGKNAINHMFHQPFIRFSAVIDLYGSSGWLLDRDAAKFTRYEKIAFDDGASFPVGALDKIEAIVRVNRTVGPVLIHCQAGLSRSVSAAYAMLRKLDGCSHDEALARVRGHPDYPMYHTLRSAQLWLWGMVQRPDELV